MSFGIISFLKSATANRGAVPVADDNPLPVYITGPAASQSGYKTIAASQTDVVLGGAGAIGDFFGALIITVNTPATAAVSIKDGAAGAVIPILPNSPGGGIGVYVVPINARSQAGGWRVTTGAGSTAVGTGSFT